MHQSIQYMAIFYTDIFDLHKSWTFFSMVTFSMDILTYTKSSTFFFHGHLFHGHFYLHKSWTFFSTGNFSMDIFTYTHGYFFHGKFFHGHFYLHKSWTFFFHGHFFHGHFYLHKSWTFFPICMYSMDTFTYTNHGHFFHGHFFHGHFYQKQNHGHCFSMGIFSMDILTYTKSWTGFFPWTFFFLPRWELRGSGEGL